MKTVAVVRNALSAAAMTALSCDRIFMLPGSTLGAAATVLTAADGTRMSKKKADAMSEASDADPELTEKGESAERALYQAMSDHTHRPVALIEAIKSVEAELWFDPVVGLTGTPRGPRARRIDGDSTLLVFTPSLAAETKLAVQAQSLEAVLSELGAVSYKPEDFASAMRQGPRRAESMTREIENTRKRIEGLASVLGLPPPTAPKSSDRGDSFDDVIRDMLGMKRRGSSTEADSARQAAHKQKLDNRASKVAEIKRLLLKLESAEAEREAFWNDPC
jgi:hypothetical protein